MNIDELEIYQTKIYYGLKTIGEEIATFYLDGVSLIKDVNYLSKSYLIGHIAREIDGGLRDILAPKENKTKFQLDDVPQKIRNHVNSILLALDSEKDMPLAKEYIDVATNFVMYAHRRGAYKNPREPEEIIQLWHRYEKILYKLFGDYINQLKHLDRILKFDVPSEYILETLPNFFNDESKKVHFYETLKNTNWFKPMYEKDFFNANTIENGKHWQQLTYLVYISEEIKEKKIDRENSKYIVDLIYKITNAANYNEYRNDIRLWYFLFKILSNLPKIYLGSDFLAIFPRFFNSTDSTLTGKGAFEFIESYFLEEKISEEGKLIVEEILKYAFELTNDKASRYLNRHEEESIYPNFESYLLKDLSESVDFCQKISSICTNSLLYHICDKLEIYLIDNYHEGIFRNSIFFENDRTFSDETIDVIYTDFLKKTISHISTIDLKRHREITETLLSIRYKHFYVRKLCFYTISLNWKNTRDLFFDLIKNNDEKHCFSNWENNEDLYFLLDKISTSLTIAECKYLEKIIDCGSQDKYFYADKAEDFKLYWLSALKNSYQFKHKFEQLSLKHNRSYESLKPKNRESIIWGSTSPISEDDFIKLNPSDLVNVIRNFDPHRGFKTPDSDGLANFLEDYFSKNPNYFTENFTLYLNVPFIYISKITYGLSSYLEKNDNINWVNILEFISQYIRQSNFKENKLKLQNGNFGYDKYSFVIASCRLLSQGCAKGDIYEKSLEPVVESIFKNYITYVEVKEDNNKTEKLGSIMHLINSNNGRILQSYFQYILGRYRDLCDNKDKSSKWTVIEKRYFTKLSNSNCKEFFMLLAYLKSNFLFIDYEWTIKKIRSIPSKEIGIIKAFFGVHISISDPTELDYIIFKNTYIEAINNQWNFDESGISNSLERHIGVFYLFSYDDFQNNSIIETFLKSKRVEKIGKLIHFYSFYVKPYVDTLELSQQRKIKDRIFILWERCYETLTQIRDNNSKNEISGLVNFLQFIDEIDQLNFNLIHKTALIAAKHWEIETILKQINRLKDKAKSQENAYYIIQLLNDTIFLDIYYFRVDKNDLFEIIEYLFELNIDFIKIQVNKICNSLAKKGLHFSTPLYEKYNSEF